MTILCQDIIKIMRRYKLYSIYKYTNVNNGKVYIGQTRNTLKERAQFEGRNYRESPKFYNAILKYGWSSFIPEILATAETPEEANALEIQYIEKYSSTDDQFGYNISPGGACSNMSDETREKISLKAKERYKDKTKNPMYGRHHSEEMKTRLSERRKGSLNPFFGKTWTDTQRQKCGTKGKKLNITEEHREILRNRARHLGATNGLRPVECIEDNLQFDSIVSAANAYGVAKSTLAGHLKGRQLSCAGKHFKYLDLIM